MVTGIAQGGCWGTSGQGRYREILNSTSASIFPAAIPTSARRG
jgi:hypothetical protein